ncbi:MAG: T9SS type A sorting domain-containing protein [candidate division WOR-3 bacterium]
MNRLCAAILILAALASAQNPYRLPEKVIDEGGDEMRPTSGGNVISHGSFHQTTIGLASAPGANYIAWIGYWHPRPNLARHDVAAVEVLSPVRFADTLNPVTPRAIVRNCGNVTEQFRVYFRIRQGNSTVYSASTLISLPRDGQTEVSFPQFRFQTLGPHVSRCSVYLALDEDRSNDVKDAGVKVYNRPDWPDNWAEVRQVPETPSRKGVRAGGWLVYLPNRERFYVAKGNKTPDFYSFDPITGTWQERDPIPYMPEAKHPGKGGAATSDGYDYIYATKGNNTFGFWRYSVVLDTWDKMTDVPAGSTGKKVKGGTGLAWVVKDGEEFVYLLKGDRNEFLRYRVAANDWQQMPPAPVGRKLKWDKGSWLVFDGDQSLYAFKAKVHELWRYDLTADTWFVQQQTPMPTYSELTNRNKKAKNGSCATWMSGAIYVLKGGNTSEFWSYHPSGDSWHELDTMPSFGSTGRRRRVNDGAGIAAYGQGVLFALKGNKTLEFWRYVAGEQVGRPEPNPGRQSIQADATDRLAQITLRVGSVIAGDHATIAYALPGSGAGTLRVFDAAGRVVRRLALAGTGQRAGLVSVEISGLAAGVYVLRLESPAGLKSAKLLVQ